MTVTSQVTLSQIERAIRDSWSSETAHSPDSWSSSNPSEGQCWTTAYVVRTLLGGDIVFAEIDGTEPRQRHAWNRLSAGLEVDLTRDQFKGTPSLSGGEVPEELVYRVSGAQAEVLLRRVREALCLK